MPRTWSVASSPFAPRFLFNLFFASELEFCGPFSLSPSRLYGVKNESSLRRPATTTEKKEEGKKGREMCPIREVHTRTSFGRSRRAGEGTPQSRSSRHVASQCQTAVVFCRLSAVHCHCQNAFYTLHRSASCAAHSSSVLPSALGSEFQTKRSGRLLSLGRPAKKSFCAAIVVRNAIELFHCSPLAWRV